MRHRSMTGWLAMGLCLTGFLAHGQWLELNLPNLGSAYAPFAMGHLADGRYVYGESGQLYLQDTFGSGSWTAFSGEPAIDPSFIAIRSSTEAVVGAGGFGNSDVYTFDPSSTASPSFTGLGLSVQNYQGVYRDGSGLYIGGLYSGFTHGIRYVSLDGAVDRIIVSNVATYSAGMAIDALGNLYVGDTDNGEVRVFTAEQLTGAISSNALEMSSGTLVHDFGGGGDIGSIAVDGQGRIWAAGYLHNGLTVYDPYQSQEFSVTPGLDNANYTVMSFLRDGESYVGYINQADPGAADSAMRYGYSLTSAVVPEPGTLLLVIGGAAVVVLRRRRG